MGVAYLKGDGRSAREVRLRKAERRHKKELLKETVDEREARR